MVSSPFYGKPSTILLLLLLVSIFTLPTTVQAAKRICSRANGSPLDSCSQDFKNMCAFFSGDYCDDSRICQKLTANDCTACSDPTVLYYFDEPCPGDKIYCDVSMRPLQCSEDVTPVCASTRENCSEESCKKTALNGCQACQDPTVLFYETGICAAFETKNFDCAEFDFATTCGETDQRPVCAFFTDNCDKEICSITVTTSCDACLDPSILYYQEGECQQEVDQRKYCLPINRPTECLINNEPVCGFSLETCQGTYCSQTFENECNACADGSISYYLPGECPVNVMEKEEATEVSSTDRMFGEEPCINCEDTEEFLVPSEEESFIEGI